MTFNQSVLRFFAGCLLAFGLADAEPIQISGVYPQLTMRNDEGECGTGAVVVWQGDLWAITYAPHMPRGSSDKLYRVSPELKQHIFEGSVGGTPANRMIHRETQQLLIGPYLIDAQKTIRVIPPTQMLGRLTANARHLDWPTSLIYYATMEEGLYLVDLKTLEVECLIRDGHAKDGPGIKSELPGYHGKGLYSSQGRVVYANNGETGPKVKVDPTVPSGALGQWFGEGDWQLIRRNQFTEVTGPGGIYGNENPDTDPIWAMGWDAKSVILALLEGGEWHFYRLPKGSHSYDGAHGWNTEWPRIREIGEDDLLATMHGTFWRFPATFSRSNSAGIEPRSNYLKVVGDFCRWGDRIVLGCDDSAKSEFLNTRQFKAEHAAAGQSNSNLWFVDPSLLDNFGPAIGRGSVWLREDVDADAVSDPYLLSGYDLRHLHLHHESDSHVTFVIEVDREGTNEWEPVREVRVPSRLGYSHRIREEDDGVWMRLRCIQGAVGVTANFQYRNRDERGEKNDSGFAGVGANARSFGLMRSLTFDRLGLVAASNLEAEDAAYYELTPQMELVRVENPKAAADLVRAVRQPENAITIDNASVLLVEDGKRYRLPKSPDFQPLAAPAVAGAGGKALVDFIGESLAINARIKAGSQHADYAAKFAADGRLTDDSRWIGSPSGERWIEIDLGETKKFRSLWIVSGWKNETDFVAKDFDVQIRRDGEWQTIPGGEIRGNAQIEREIVLDEPIATRNLRLQHRGAGFFRIYEFALFDRELEIEENSLSGFGHARICREVATERDLLNVHGAFYELPARNAQGVAKIRPIATHNLPIHDFCSHNGLLLLTGIDAETESNHIFRSSDGLAAIWAGVVDDLWKLGKPRGVGGPWKDTAVKASEPSDPYLMTAYDKKSVSLHSTAASVLTLEVDIDGTGLWVPYRQFELAADETVGHEFDETFGAYWIRAVSGTDTTASVTLTYE